MKMTNKIYSIMAAVCLLMPFAANAGMAKGDHELSFTGSIQSGDTGDTTLLFGTYGVMILDNLQVKAATTLVESDGFLFGLIGGGADFFLSEDLLGMEDVIPYTGGSITFSIGDAPSTTFLEGHAGAKKFISESTALFVEARLLTDTSDFLSTNTLMLLTGISITFNSK